MDSEAIFTGERFVPGIMDAELEMEHMQRYSSIVELVKDKIVVDAACGEGYGSAILGTTAASVMGFDIDHEAVKRAAEKYGCERVSFTQANVKNLPLENNSVDVFVSFETIEHVDEDTQNQFILEIHRVLKPDGILIMSSPNKAIYSDLFDYHNEFHVHEMYKDEFLNLLGSRFSNIKLFHQYFEVASILDGEKACDNQTQYVKDDSTYNLDGKYFVAIAANRDINDLTVQSVHLSKTPTYLANVQRILKLQAEEESRNEHIKKLDSHIEDLGGIIRHYKDEQNDIKNQIIDIQKKLILSFEKNNAQSEEIKQLRIGVENEIHDIELQKNELETQITNLNAHIQGLNTHIQELNNEINCKNTHIANIEPGYRRWMKMAHNPVSKVLTLPYRIPRKIYRHYKYAPKMDTLVIPTFARPKVSIVIPVYNQFDYTFECIRSIINTTKDISYEIILGDDMSTDETKRIKKHVVNLKVNKNKTDHGFLMNCNRAARLAKGEYIVFLNNDTRVHEEWLSYLVRLIESDDSIGMVGSKLLYPDGRLQEAGGIVWNDASAWNYGHGQDPYQPQFNYVKEVDYISGASIMIRKELWKELGGFDERYKPAYCEDSDLAFQVRKAGYKVMYQPKSVVTHFEGVSNGTDLNTGLKKYQVENTQKFKEKWSQELKSQYTNAQDVFRARDRRYKNRTVLIIDHYVPTFDKDAGSKTTFQYIKMFLRKGYNVKFIGDNYASMEPYTTILGQMGVEVLYGPWYAQHIFEWLEENKKYIDIVYLNRPHITEKYIDYFCENTNLKLIYYGHDLHFLRTQREAELDDDLEKLEEAKTWREKELNIMRKVDISYYPSCVEASAIHTIDSSIKVKAITAYVFESFKEHYQYRMSERKDILFVGGFAHAPNVDAVKWFVDKVWPIVHKRLDTQFIIVGSNAPEEIQKLDGDGIVFKGYVSDEELAHLYTSCRMVVVPLRYGAGVKGKVIEALYNGLPIVTTSVGAEGISGIENVVVIQDDPYEFANEVVRLYTDEKALVQMAEKTQDFIKKYFSIEAVWDIIKEDFE